MKTTSERIELANQIAKHINTNGTIGEKYATPGRFGWELIEAAKKEVRL